MAFQRSLTQHDNCHVFSLTGDVAKSDAAHMASAVAWVSVRCATPIIVDLKHLWGFARASARMSVMWHLAVDYQVVGPAYADMRTQHDGPVTIAQDLTTFDISADSIVTRQSTIDPAA